MSRCVFCGSDGRCRGTTEPRAPHDVGGRVVYSATCAELEQLRQAATPAPARILVEEIDGRRDVDQLAFAGNDVAQLVQQVRERIAGGPVAIISDLRTWSARWRRRYACCGESDERALDGVATYAEALTGILAWEDRADAEDAAGVAGLARSGLAMTCWTADHR